MRWVPRVSVMGNGIGFEAMLMHGLLAGCRKLRTTDYGQQTDLTFTEFLKSY
jgi:hypothetical protein